MVGRVGKDSFGPSLLEGLRSYGVDVQAVAEDPDNPSGIAMILLDSVRQNHIVAIYGANAACDEAQLEATYEALDGADTLLLQLEIPSHLSLMAARHAMSRDIRVIWDPAPARIMPSDAYAAADVLTPNQIEASSLTGINVTDAASAEAAAQVLLDRGTAAAVVKLGDLGVYYASGNGSGFVPPYPVDVVDTVAAGDAFGAALAVALSEGSSLPDAVRYGAAAGALAVSKPGAQEAMPARRDVDSLFTNS